MEKKDQREQHIMADQKWSFHDRSLIVVSLRHILVNRPPFREYSR